MNVCPKEFSIPDQNIEASSFCTKNKFVKRNVKSTSFEKWGKNLNDLIRQVQNKNFMNITNSMFLSTYFVGRI